MEKPVKIFSNINGIKYSGGSHPNFFFIFFRTHHFRRNTASLSDCVGTNLLSALSLRFRGSRSKTGTLTVFVDRACGPLAGEALVVLAFGSSRAE